jgi:group I intron endonuclease
MTWPIVYVATNRVNGKRYVGVTKRLLCQRRAHHYCMARSGKGNCKKFHAAIRKYGETAFHWQTIATFQTYAEALKGEIEAIATMKPEYNLTVGGEGTIGVKRSQETIDKHRASRAGWRPTEEQRRRQSEAQNGHVLSAETRRKISESNKGLKRSDEAKAKMRARTYSPSTRAKMRAAKQGRKLSMETRAKMSLAQKHRYAAQELMI